MKLELATCVRFFGFLLLFAFIKVFGFLIVDLVGEDAQEVWEIISNSKPRPTYITESQVTPSLTVRCGNLQRYDALVVVHIRALDFTRRQEYRQAYGNYGLTNPIKLKVVFLLGQVKSSFDQQRIVREHRGYRDIVQGPFLDTYGNLTYKAAMGFSWMSQSCSNVSVVIKMDDDVIFDFKRFFQEFWPVPSYNRNIIFCHVYGDGVVERKGKWMVPRVLYSKYSYPPYCSGALVVIPFHMASELYRLSRSEPVIIVDDAFMYGIIRVKSEFAQVLHLDQFAVLPKDYARCQRTFGPRCKYFGAQLNKTDSFVESLMELLQMNQKRQETDYMKTIPGYFANVEA